jgi:uroporphyrinogen decarboxylase
MTMMTPRERVRAVLNHTEPDRIPIDQGGGDFHNDIHEVAYANLLRHLGLEEEIQIYDYMQRLAVVSEPVRRRLHSDVRYFYANASSTWRFVEEVDRSWVDEWGVRRQLNGLYADTIESPLNEARSIVDLKEFPWPDPTDPARFAGLREQVKQLYENTDFALAGANAASLQFLAGEIRGFERFLEDLMWDRPFAEALVDKILDWQVQFFGKFLDAVGEYVEIVWMGDDWGTQQAPLMNPRIFREMFVPRYKELVASIKSKTRAKVALHSCGSIAWALPDFIEVGLDIIHPMQGAAKDMDPVRIKQEFGEQLSFYSGINNQETLPKGTSEQVTEEVKRKINAYAPGGGYIFSCGHNIQADVPPENVLAAIDAALEFGKYPIK